MPRSKRPDIDIDKDDIRQIAAWAESKAQLRTSGAAIKGHDGAGAALLYTAIPTDVDKELAFDATANLAAMEEYEKKLTDEELSAEAAEMDFFLRCKSCHRPAIYFTRNPAYGGPIGRREWYARYKKPNELHYNPVVCQVCLAMGTPGNYVSIEWNAANQLEPNASFRPAMRHTFKVPKDPAMAKFTKACRVWRIPGEVNNQHIPEWEDRLAQWRGMSDDEKAKHGWKPKAVATEEVAHAV